MFAVIKTGGKQYRVEANQVIKIEKLEVAQGGKIEFNEVLLLNDGKTVQAGTPLVAGAVVEAEVVSQMRDRKVIIFKKKRRHNYRRKKGHRQHITVVKIVSINAGSAPKAKAKTAAATAEA